MNAYLILITLLILGALLMVLGIWKRQNGWMLLASVDIIMVLLILGAVHYTASAGGIG